MKPEEVVNESTALPTRPTGPTTRSQAYKQEPIGTIVKRKFNDGKWYEGEVTHYDPINKLYKIKYRDGDTEDYDHSEMKEIENKNSSTVKLDHLSVIYSKNLTKTSSSSQQRLHQILSNEIINDNEHRFSSSISLTNSRQSVMNLHLQQADAYGMMN